MVDPKCNHIEIVDTRTKILSVANLLFAQKGFDGVSIRDIAQEANVNVASINYHFKNKVGLFHSIFEYNYYWMENEVKKITETNNIHSEDASWEIFKVFYANGTVLINAFNLILRDQLQPEEGLMKDKEKMGPPGQEALLKIITKETGEHVPFDKREWATRVIFSHIFHGATMMNTSFVKQRCANEPWMTPEQKEKEIKLLAKAVIKELKS